MGILDSSKIEDFHWLCATLTAVEQRLYQYLQIVGTGATSIGQIAAATRMGEETVRQKLKRLSKLNLVRYSTTPSGTYIEWVAQYQGEKPPLNETIRYRRGTRGYRLKSPDGKLHSIEPGRLHEFCKNHHLVYRNTWGVCNGERKSHKGWKAA